MTSCAYCSRELRHDGKCPSCDERFPSFWPWALGLGLIFLAVLFFIGAAVIGGGAAGVN